MFWRKKPIVDFIPDPFPDLLFDLKETLEGTILRLYHNNSQGNECSKAFNLEKLLAYAKGFVRQNEPSCYLDHITYHARNTLTLPAHYFTEDGKRASLLFCDFPCPPHVFYKETNAPLSEPDHERQQPKPSQRQ